MAENLQLAENVIIIDVAYLNQVITDVKGILEDNTRKTLSDIDLGEWLVYFSLDAGIREGDHKTQVLFIYDGQISDIHSCLPSDLKELDAMACKTVLGELIFSAISSEGFVSQENVYLDLMTLAMDSSDVKRLVLFPSVEYGAKVKENVRKINKGHKEVVCFSLDMPQEQKGFRADSIIFSLMHAWGIKQEDLGIPQ